MRKSDPQQLSTHSPPEPVAQQENTVLLSELQQHHLSSEQAGRLAMYDELTAVLAHEINNPVYAARLALELLGQDLESSGSESNYLEIATDGLRRVSAIIERLRCAIRNETLPSPVASLDGLIAEAQRGHDFPTDERSATS